MTSAPESSAPGTGRGIFRFGDDGACGSEPTMFPKQGAATPWRRIREAGAAVDGGGARQGDEGSASAAGRQHETGIVADHAQLGGPTTAARRLGGRMVGSAATLDNDANCALFGDMVARGGPARGSRPVVGSDRHGHRRIVLAGTDLSRGSDVAGERDRAKSSIPTGRACTCGKRRQDPGLRVGPPRSRRAAVEGLRKTAAENLPYRGT